MDIPKHIPQLLLTFILLHSSSYAAGSTNSSHQSLDVHPQYKHSSRYSPEYLPTADIMPICDAFITSFADASSNFTRCFLVNSRPIDLCEMCIGEYLLVNKAYDDLEQADDEVKEEGAAKVEDCNSWILNADRVMAIQQTKLFYEDMWDISECKNCFESYSYDNGSRYKTADHFLQFQELDQLTQDCFSNYTGNVSSPTGDGKSEACVKCKTEYDKLNEYYMTLDTEYGDKLCMDIVDSMNYTRLVWSTEFNCTGNTRQDGITITISVLFLFMPAVFYIASHIHYQRLEKKIVKQNRMRRFRTSSGRGSAIDVLSSDSFHTAAGLQTPNDPDSNLTSVELHASSTFDITVTPAELMSSANSDRHTTPNQSYESVNS